MPARSSASRDRGIVISIIASSMMSTSSTPSACSVRVLVRLASSNCRMMASVFSTSVSHLILGALQYNQLSCGKGCCSTSISIVPRCCTRPFHRPRRNRIDFWQMNDHRRVLVDANAIPQPLGNVRWHHDLFRKRRQILRLILFDTMISSESNATFHECACL